MKSLNDMRAEYGWFSFPEPEQVHAAISRIEYRIGRALPALTERGVKGRLLRAARLDLAGQALSQGDGYRRRVRSFGELTQPELVYVEAWLAQADLKQELAGLGWLPGPTPRRITQLLKEDAEIPPRTRERLLARYIPDVA